MQNYDIHWTEEERELNRKVSEIMENERNTEDVYIRERIREQIFESEKGGR